jgi:Raf kinase inhibitor-like YbhB/YbcL family protein
MSNELIITSSAFKEDGLIPLKYTCDGQEVSPPLNIDGIPQNTRTLAIIAEDPDAPNGTFDHWLVWNIEPVTHIQENASPGICGKNGAGKNKYHPPCPPEGYHHYIFNVFALDAELSLEEGADKKALQEAMASHILAKGTLMGRFQKVKLN